MKRRITRHARRVLQTLEHPS